VSVFDTSDVLCGCNNQAPDGFLRMWCGTPYVLSTHPSPLRCFVLSDTPFARFRESATPEASLVQGRAGPGGRWLGGLWGLKARALDCAPIHLNRSTV